MKRGVKMKKVGLILILAVFLSGCINLSEDDAKKLGNDLSNTLIVCEEPYMRLGSDCCLDKDSNKICDKDESGSDTLPPTNQEDFCSSPYIQVGTECCLDQNNNKICDSDDSDTEAPIVTTDDDNNEETNDGNEDIVAPPASDDGTLLAGAEYGEVRAEDNQYYGCQYTSADDGWDVTKIGSISYYNPDGSFAERTDQCEYGTNNVVVEYDCETINGKSYERYRLVTCPVDWTCEMDPATKSNIEPSHFGKCVEKYNTVTLPFSDNFEEPSTVENYFKTTYGSGDTWEFKNGVASMTKFSGDLCRKTKGSMDYDLEVDFKNSYDGGILVRGIMGYYGISGPLFKWAPGILNPYNQIFYDEGDTYWRIASPGTEGGWGHDTEVHSVPHKQRGSDVHLKIEVRGNTFTPYVDGQAYPSFVDSDDVFGDEDEDRWICLSHVMPGGPDVSGDESFDNLKITPS